MMSWVVQNWAWPQENPGVMEKHDTIMIDCSGVLSHGHSPFCLTGGSLCRSHVC